MRTSRLCGAAGVVLGIALAAGCATNPATGKRELNLISEQQELQLGDQAAPDAVKQFGGLYPDQAVQQEVSEVGMKLAAAAPRPNMHWSYQVVNSDEVNAFALPGGHIYITQGLLRRLKNESQLAAVLGHETGHVAAQHQVQAMSRAGLLQQAIGVTGSLAGQGAVAQLGAGAVNVASQLYLLKFSRGEEAQADELGMNYMVKAGYDPHGMPDLLNVLLAYEKEAGGGKTPEFLVNHPATDQRVKDTQDQLAKQFGNIDASRLVKDSPRFDQTVAQMGPAPKASKVGTEGKEAPPVPAGVRSRGR